MRRAHYFAITAVALALWPTARAAPNKPDTTPPQVSITASPAPGAPAGGFLVDVAVTDDVGVSTVFVSLDGAIVAGRTVPRFSAIVASSTSPAQVCAVAADLSGNAGQACVTVSPCSDNAGCATGLYCAKAVGDCAGAGLCQTRPGICALDLDPVCGCDGVTYTNACQAAADGINVAHAGVCP